MARVDLKEYVRCAAAVLILAAMAFHGIGMHHDHPHEFGEGVQAILHGEDRRLFLLLLLALSILTAAMVAVFVEVKSLTPQGRVSAEERNRNLLDPLRIALRRGTMHPKFCE